MEECKNTVTLDRDEYGALMMHFEKINAVERFLNNNEYATVKEIAAILDIQMPKKEV